ncbi:hypothetical protein ONE63_000059 [Megalurothrips usitatus]|uniref:C2H2-type domain-containing protein n=1 Tax=Megalurothrips usitatus TaxID=439358 RepID=A0AAV7Y0C2_9NEOP|nr:hypothetical protein ONE63_000059 [Megalurothrips usitatus]
MATGPDVNLSADLSCFLDVTIEEDQGAVTTSTPKCSVRPSRARKRPPVTACSASTFKRPASRKDPGPVIATCETCGAQYRTLRYLNLHKQKHLLRDLASRVPDVESLKDKCQDIGSKTLTVMASKPSVGKFGSAFVALLNGTMESVLDCEEWNHFVWQICQPFCKLLSQELFCMPSSLTYTALRVADDILSNLPLREQISSSLNSILKCHSDLCESFLSEFVITFADQLVIFIFRSLRNATESDPIAVPDVTFDQEERQCMFYIGGSIFHGFKQLGSKYTKSKKWQSVVEIIDSRILETDFYENLQQQLKKDREWTEKRNRGGLKFVTGKTQDFLLSVASIIVGHEQKFDGSLPVDDILKKVVVGKPKYNWGNIIGSALEQEFSLSFMTGVAKSLISTYGKGIIKRHMNLINDNKPSVSITLRHKVAPR